MPPCGHSAAAARHGWPHALGIAPRPALADPAAEAEAWAAEVAGADHGATVGVAGAVVIIGSST